MLKYLVILLDDTSVSYCHYDVPAGQRRLIGIDDLKAGILFAMKKNLNIQFVYPDYELPEAYAEVIETIDHAEIKPAAAADADTDVIVLADWNSGQVAEVAEGATCTVRASRKELVAAAGQLKRLMGRVARLNIVLTDVQTFRDADIAEYRQWLADMADWLSDLLGQRRDCQLNLLTDRLMLTQMNSCNAGVESLALAPNGRFYLCPAFYYDHPADSVGTPAEGLTVKNQHLLQLDYAPLCRHCDAYQCRRCVWLNGKLTQDANIPSHQQCVLAHLERNASCTLLQRLKARGVQIGMVESLEEQEELDPFNLYKRW